jgi:hypothetical protein
LAARSQNDPDFASANAAVYTKLWLQISLISWTAKRECAISPVFLSSHNQRSLSQNADALCFATAAMTATKCPHHYSRAEGKL